MATNNATNTSNPVTVAQGGTGLATLTAHSVQVGNGTGTVTQIAVGGNNSILMGNTGADPAFTTSGSPFVSGISFDSGSNTLSTYVQGTFTPTVTNTGSAPTVTYGTQVGRYTQIGNRVVLTCRVVLTAYTAGTGNVQISGMPVTSNSTTNNSHISAINLQQVTFGVGVLYYTGLLTPSSTAMDIAGIITASASLNLAAAGPGATAVFDFSYPYEV